jgi:phosphoglycerate dehydrogenase-like enzyme
MDNVLITPHLASVAIPASAAQQVADNIQRAARGEPVTGRSSGAWLLSCRHARCHATRTTCGSK